MVMNATDCTLCHFIRWTLVLCVSKGDPLTHCPVNSDGDDVNVAERLEMTQIHTDKKQQTRGHNGHNT